MLQSGACGLRCFGLPLYNASAREALAARLGLLPFGVERTTFGGKLRLCLRRSYLLKISRPVWSEKTRRGKHRGKQLMVAKQKPRRYSRGFWS